MKKTKIIFTATSGKLDFYLEDYAQNLAQCGNDVKFIPLAYFNNKPFYRFWEKEDDFKYRKLEEVLNFEKSDILICNFSSLRFDFAKIRSFFKGKIVLYDMEGPNFKGDQNTSWLKYVDLIVTVSRITAQNITKQGGTAIYIPHGVECNRFKRIDSLDGSDSIFRRKGIFIGRPAPHRVELLKYLVDNGCDLTLYGRKWRYEKKLCAQQSPFQKDITGKTLLKAVSGAEFAINILQNQFVELKTLMNLQTFFYAAMGCPLLTEFVEELPECFEEDKEMFFFRNKEELLEKIRMVQQHPHIVRIGQRARERVLKEHTLLHRAQLFNKYLQQL